MNLCISNIAWDAMYDNKMYKICSDMGYDGVEIAPTRLFPNEPYDNIDEAKKWARNLEHKYGLKVYSCQSIWYGRKENVFGSSKEREILLEYSKKAFSFAEALKAKNVVIGCPKNRNGYIKDMQSNEAISIEFFSKLAEIAYEYDIILSIEPIPTIYGTDFLNNIYETVHFIERIDRNSIRLNLDIGEMLYNHENVNMLKGWENSIGHVHISEPRLSRIIKRNDHKTICNFLNGFGYKKAVSIEIGMQETIEEICKTMEYIHNIFKGNVE